MRGARVIDLTANIAGAYCTRVLGGAGADVVKVEPPAGDPARRVGPFADDVPGSDRSLFFWYYNTNKRGVTLDVAHPDGPSLLRRLLAGVDIVVDSHPPGYLEERGLAYDDLLADGTLAPSVIYTAITPFGRTGP